MGQRPRGGRARAGLARGRRGDQPEVHAGVGDDGAGTSLAAEDVQSRKSACLSRRRRRICGRVPRTAKLPQLPDDAVAVSFAWRCRQSSCSRRNAVPVLPLERASRRTVLGLEPKKEVPVRGRKDGLSALSVGCRQLSGHREPEAVDAAAFPVDVQKVSGALDLDRRFTILTGLQPDEVQPVRPIPVGVLVTGRRPSSRTCHDTWHPAGPSLRRTSAQASLIPSGVVGSSSARQR